MSELGVLSDRYQRISEWLIIYNEAVMLLKDVYLGKVQYESKAVEACMDTISTFFKQILKLEVTENPSQHPFPQAAILAVQNAVAKDPFLLSTVKTIYQRLTVDRFKKGLSKVDFDVLDNIVAILSENSSQAFRRIWRHG